MRLVLHHRFVRSTHDLDSLVEERILALAPRLAIEQANICLEHRPEASPAYRVTIHLVVPGPDLRAEAVNHTLPTAFDKALAALEAQWAKRARGRRGFKTSGPRAGFRRDGDRVRLSRQARRPGAA